MRWTGAALTRGLMLLGLTACTAAQPPPTPPFDPPPGYALRTYALVPGARSLALSRDGRTLYVGTADGTIAAVQDQDADGVADRAVRLVGGLDGAASVASGPDGALYAIDRRRVWRLREEGPLEVVVPEGVLPGSGPEHRPAAFGPDDRLYIGVPAACARCALGGFQGTILRMGQDGHELEVFARGVRQPTAFGWHPATGDLFFVDRQDPARGPGELNRASATGLHFGYPAAAELGAEAGAGLQEAALPSPTFPAVLDLHPAGATALHFYEGSMFPDRLRGDALVTLREAPGEASGAALLRVRFGPAGGPVAAEVFARVASTGSGPVAPSLADLEELPDGSILIADDRAGVIYRLSYGATR